MGAGVGVIYSDTRGASEGFHGRLITAMSLHNPKGAGIGTISLAKKPVGEGFHGRWTAAHCCNSDKLRNQDHVLFGFVKMNREPRQRGVGHISICLAKQSNGSVIPILIPQALSLTFQLWRLSVHYCFCWHLHATPPSCFRQAPHSPTLPRLPSSAALQHPRLA